MRTSLAVVLLVVACSKSSSEQKASGGSGGSAGATAGSAGATAGSAGSAGSGSSAPVEAAAVSGPTRSVTGSLEVTGAITGKFEWIKKDQKRPITCAWGPEKEIGSLSLDLSDGAGKLLKVNIDVPPSDAGIQIIEIKSDGLTAPLKTNVGFTMSGESAEQFQVKFDNATLTEDGTVPEAPKSGKKGAPPPKAEAPAGPTLKLNGTLEVTCPAKK